LAANVSVPTGGYKSTHQPVFTYFLLLFEDVFKWKESNIIICMYGKISMGSGGYTKTHRDLAIHTNINNIGCRVRCGLALPPQVILPNVFLPATGTVHLFPSLCSNQH
jgi:hypothetical protein